MSCTFISKALSPSIKPVRPPVINEETVPIANNIAGVKRILALHRVASQLNTLTADGMAINNVVNVKTDPRKGFIPVINI